MSDFNDLSSTEQIFYDAAVEAGLPVDTDTMKAEFQQMGDEAGLGIRNPSAYSAFWVFVLSAISQPVLWLTAFVVRQLMPNQFVFTATGGFLDIHASTYGLERKPGVAAKGVVVFSRPGMSGRVLIPAGTKIRTAPINGVIYRVATVEDTDLPDGAASVRVKVRAEGVGPAYNLGAGYYSILDSNVSGVAMVTNPADWLETPGADIETDAELRLRVQNIFLAVGDWHTDAKYKAMISERAGIGIDQIYIEHDAPRGPGTANVYILFDAGTSPTSIVEDLNSYIMDEGNHGHGDSVLVSALPETTVNLGVQVYFLPSTGEERIEALLERIRNVIRCAFRQNTDFPDVTKTRPFSRFSISDLGRDIHNHVPEVESLIFDRGDLISNLEIHRLGTLTATRVKAGES